MANNETARAGLQMGFSVSHEMLRLIVEIDEFKGRWEALQTLSPERLRPLRHDLVYELSVYDRKWVNACRQPNERSTS